MLGLVGAHLSPPSLVDAGIPAPEGAGTALIEDSQVECILVHAHDGLFLVVDVHHPPDLDDRLLGGALTLVATRHPVR